MISCEICQIFKNNYFEEHRLPLENLSNWIPSKRRVFSIVPIISFIKQKNFFS